MGYALANAPQRRHCRGRAIKERVPQEQLREYDRLLTAYESNSVREFILDYEAKEGL
jgi:hypothetical protein